MKHSIQYFIYAGVVLLLTSSCSEAFVHKHKSYHAKIPLAHSHHNLLELRNLNETDSNNEELPPKDYHGIKKETSKCEFPSDAGLVAVTPKAKNAGWAMSPDEQCSPGSYCPYACPSGKVMAQWNPEAKAYTYPQSMDGGLYCDHDGKVKKPFPEKPYCVSGTGGVEAHNKIGMGVSFCQTVLPGNEAMLIPTHVEESTELAVPGTNYWCNTAAHYYINPPGVGVEDACIWGDGTKPVGNWSPYVAGANTDESGKTFVKVGWNPIYTGSSLSGTPPEFGVRIVCEKGDCNGTPCSIDPSTDGVGGVMSADKASGAGGASFCVVTVPKGSKANIEVFQAGSNHKHEDPKDDDHKDKDPKDDDHRDKDPKDDDHRDKDPKDDDHKDKDHKDKDPKDDDHKDKDHKDKDPQDDDRKDKDHKDKNPQDDDLKEIEDDSDSLSLDDTSPIGEKTPTSIASLSPNTEKLPADFPISESRPVDSYQGETLTPFLKSGNGEETRTSVTSDKEMDQIKTESEASTDTSSFDSNVNSLSEQSVQEPSDPSSNSHRADQNQATSRVPSALFEMGSDEPSMTPVGLKQTDKTESSSEQTSSSISLKTSSHTFITTFCLFLLTFIHA
ncbi:putative secreted beta-glucosidase adg3 [Golovinomyces cichoracearum]|uniref:Putative secreted beta-glucosidase adg3 n=1 Tax=Golovinomyces cichoracearum TaxID=62708 RepID=A0A420J8R3_9PEZI|nr:putative secreted beta-glucosidase adg3 [Golovinomyces cichoracearum]